MTREQALARAFLNVIADGDRYGLPLPPFNGASAGASLRLSYAAYPAFAFTSEKSA